MVRWIFPLTLAWILLLAFCACSGNMQTIELDSGPDVEDSQVQIVPICASDSECDDEDPCTKDYCSEAGKCAQDPAPGEVCDDGNPCTTGDLCGEDGTCGGGEALVCNDENPCTNDVCKVEEGCVFEPSDKDLECDGTPCTSGDQCIQGACVAGTLVECVDANPDDCTFFTCDAGTGECTVAQTHLQGHPCADGNPCTDNDVCDGKGVCQPGTQHSCVSQHPCKAAWCNDQAKEGTNPCVADFLPEGTPCDDGSKCTDGDKCAAPEQGPMQCIGTPIGCDDGNACTLDTCTEEDGCAFSPKADGTLCGGNELCGGQAVCKGGQCQWGQGQGCDDGIACTQDSCLPDGNCQNVPVDSVCNDNDACTGVETCKAGQGCVGGTPIVCNDGVACTQDSCQNGQCVYSPQFGSCNDGNICTDDVCQVPAGCSNTPNNVNCDDGNPCTSGDQCVGGSCQSGGAANCDDGNSCTEDSCDLQKGCVHVPKGAGCGACDPYKIETCYSGPGGTEGKGACKAGFRQCLATGLDWSPCYGQVLPLTTDICGNNLDDDCDGTQADEACSDVPDSGVWADYDYGSDTTGNGSFKNPYKTATKAVSTGSKLVMLKADADGTIYPEEVSLGAVVNGITIKGWGPQRPVIQGRLYLVHCYDCVFDNLELRYAKPGQFENPPGGTIDAVHNYRNVFSRVKLSAPDGLPSGMNLARCHHGYDNLFVDVEIDDVVLQPVDGTSTNALLNWQDHGSGSQFVRVKLGNKITVQGGLPGSLGLTFISVGGYCSNWPKGVSGIRNCVAGNLDVAKLSTGSSSFTAFNYWCYFPSENASGVAVVNNTVANIKAGSVTALTASLAYDFELNVSSNIFGPFEGASSTGVSCGSPLLVHYTDLFGVTMPYSGKAGGGVGNISSDPMFQAPGNGDFHLKPGSPCIDTGDPILPDVNGSAGDMGAYGGPYAG